MPPKNKRTTDEVSVKLLLQELAGAETVSKESINAGLSKDEVLQALFASASSMLEKCITKTADDKIQISAAVNNGPWDEQQKKQLARILISPSGANAEVLESKRRQIQKCTNLENMLDENVWYKLRDKKYPRVARRSTLGRAMADIGIELPSEPTLYRGVAILNYCDETHDMSQDDVLEEMSKLQEACRAGPSEIA